MSQMYRVATPLSSLSSGVTYTAPTTSTAGYENGIHSITFQAIGGDATLHDTSDYDAKQRTIKENSSVTFNERYLEGKQFFFKSASGTVEILIVPGIGT